MIKFENTEVVGWEQAIRGMRNPMNSWDKSDSGKCEGHLTKQCENISNCHFAEYENIPYCIGENDLSLMNKLVKAGTDHRKFMRMITVYVDITAPLYWWKEFDTYKVGTVANSTSTMHKIQAKEFKLEDFSHEHLISDEYSECHVIRDDMDGGHNEAPLDILEQTIEMLNVCRKKYLVSLKTEEETGLSAKDIWWQMIQLLPSSYNQKRTVQMNYEVLANIYKPTSRRYHKLDEWCVHEDGSYFGFCDWIRTLPYSELITQGE